MAKVYIDDGDGFKFIGEAGPLRIDFGSPDALESEVVLEDILDAEILEEPETLIING